MRLESLGRIMGVITMALVIATLLIANHAMAFFATTVRSLYGGYSITAYAGTNGVTIVKHNAVTGDTVYNVDPTSNGYKATYYAINNHITTTPRQVTTPVNTQVVTKTVTITNTITNTITKYYYPIITYTVQYLMTWMTPSGMCENGLCGLNPSLLMPTMPREGHGNGNNGNKWGHFIYIPAVTAVFNYTGFGLQVGVKLVPQITGWTSSSSTSTSTSSFTTTSQSVQTITRDITSTIPSQPPTAYFSYGGGGSNNPPTPSTAIVKYPVYSTNLDLPTVLVKTGGFGTALVLDVAGDSLYYGGLATYGLGRGMVGTGSDLMSTAQSTYNAGVQDWNNAVHNAQNTNNYFLKAWDYITGGVEYLTHAIASGVEYGIGYTTSGIGHGLETAGVELAKTGYNTAVYAKQVGDASQNYGTSGSYQTTKVLPGQTYIISNAPYSTGYNGLGPYEVSNVYPTPTPVNLGW